LPVNHLIGGKTQMQTNLEELAFAIADLLTKYNCQEDVTIYFNNQRLSTFTEGKWVLEEGYKGSDYTKYANDKTITMTFEGPFYDVINYNECPELLRRFNELIESYGYYYELGYPWSLSLYEL
jgi:hypothetical protein